jgi:hypothetical protein
MEPPVADQQGRFLLILRYISHAGRLALVSRKGERKDRAGGPPPARPAVAGIFTFPFGRLLGDWLFG